MKPSINELVVITCQNSWHLRSSHSSHRPTFITIRHNFLTFHHTLNMATLDHLPHELIEIILQYVAEDYEHVTNKHDLFNLRLTCRTLSNLTTPFYFKSIPLWIGLESLKHLTLLSEHEHFASLVEEVVFSPLQVARIDSSVLGDV